VSRTGVFVQMRLGSTRLPGKVLKPIAGLSIARHVMRALSAASAPMAVRVVLTDEASAAALAAAAAAEKWDLFVGPEQDVLRRYALAARRYTVDRVIRATGDAPLVSAPLAAEILAIHEERHADLSHFLGCPLGTGVEVIETVALLRADAEATAADEREHVTMHLYRCGWARVEEPWCRPECRRLNVHVTIDTENDYEKVQRIFADLYHGAPIETEAVVRWLQGHGG
jgi:spore coat polysaccharide biosynthesis protein SpsF